jgi:hypothetical protein
MHSMRISLERKLWAGGRSYRETDRQTDAPHATEEASDVVSPFEAAELTSGRAATDDKELMFFEKRIQVTLQRPGYDTGFVLQVLCSHPASISWENSSSTVPQFLLDSGDIW